jgi:hypothetical protein
MIVGDVDLDTSGTSRFLPGVVSQINLVLGLYFLVLCGPPITLGVELNDARQILALPFVEFLRETNKLQLDQVDILS